MKKSKTNYDKAKAYLKGFSIGAKMDSKKDYDQIKKLINIEAQRIAKKMDLNEYKTSLLLDYAFKLHPKNKPIKKMKCYIKFLDCKNNFKETKKDFESHEEAMDFMIETFDKVDSDLIRYY